VLRFTIQCIISHAARAIECKLNCAALCRQLWSKGVRVIAADLRIAKRPPFSKSDWLQSVASSGLPGTTAGGTGVGEGDVKDVIAHLLAAEGRAQEHIARGSVTAKRMTLVFRGMASLALADFTGEPVRVGGGATVVTDVVAPVPLTVADVIQTCRQAMAAYNSGSIVPLPDYLARIQTAGLVPTAAVPRSATRSAVAKGPSRGAKRGGSAAAPTVPDQVAESKLFVARLLEQVHDFGDASPLLLQVSVTLDSEDGEARVLIAKDKSKDSRTYEVGSLFHTLNFGLCLSYCITHSATSSLYPVNMSHSHLSLSPSPGRMVRLVRGKTYIFAERHTYLRKDIHICGKTYIFAEKHTYLRKDIHICGKTYIFAERQYIFAERHTYLRKDIHICR